MEITPDVIDRIDTLRYESPTEAYAFALDLFSSGPMPTELAPGIHGAFGSVLRMLNDLSGAERAIQWGLHLTLDDSFTEGRLYQRLSYVRGDRSDFSNAAQFSKQAVACFELSGSEDWKTIAVFDQGRLLCQDDRWAEGLDLLQKAHHNFSPDAPEEFKTSVLVQTALAYDGLGKPEEGLSWLRRSKEHQLSPWLEIRRTWTEARLRSSVEDFTIAQALYRQIIDFFKGVNNTELALAQLDLAKCHLLNGEREEGKVLLHDLQRSIPRLAQAR